MIIGNPSVFACKFELNEDHGKGWLFGKFCYIVCDTDIGKYDDGATLRDLYIQSGFIRQAAGNRHSDELCAYDKDTRFVKIDSALYPGYDTVNNLGSDPERFNISPGIDIFDDVKIFMVDCSNYSRIIWSYIDSGFVEERCIQIGIFDAVLAETLDIIKQWYDKNPQF